MKYKYIPSILAYFISNSSHFYFVKLKFTFISSGFSFVLSDSILRKTFNFISLLRFFFIYMHSFLINVVLIFIEFFLSRVLLNRRVLQLLKSLMIVSIVSSLSSSGSLSLVSLFIFPNAFVFLKIFLSF